MLIEALRLLEEPAREWVVSPQKSIVGCGWSPMVNVSLLCMYNGCVLYS
jgi:hypothetical protein